MNVLIVLCHPEKQSFNASLKNRAVEVFSSDGATVEVSDLYAEQFDPVEKSQQYPQPLNAEIFEPLAEQRHAYKSQTIPADVKREIDRLERCDLAIFQFPLWWHQQPAMLKGWFDRVFLAGGLYTSKMRYDKGYFKGKRAVCSVTSGAPKNTFTEKGRAGGDIATLLYSLNFSLHYMGFSVLPPRLIPEIHGAGFTYKSAQDFSAGLLLELEHWATYLQSIDTVPSLNFPGWESWDDRGVER